MSMLVYDPSGTYDLGLRPVNGISGFRVTVPIDLAWYRDEFLATSHLADSNSWQGGAVRFSFSNTSQATQLEGERITNQVYDATSSFHTALSVPVWGATASGALGTAEGSLDLQYFPAAWVFNQEYGFDPGNPFGFTAPTHNYRIVTGGVDSSQEIYSGNDEHFDYELTADQILSGRWLCFLTSNACVNVGVYT